MGKTTPILLNCRIGNGTKERTIKELKKQPEMAVFCYIKLAYIMCLTFILLYDSIIDRKVGESCFVKE